MSTIRGLTTFNGVLYAVRDADLIRLDSAGAATTIGAIGSAGGPVDFAANLTQLGIADGYGLWVYNGTTLVQSPDYVPGTRIGTMDQRTFGIQLSSQRFAWSDLADMMSFPALNFASAESVPDNLVGMAVVYGELLLMGEYSGEVWTSTGGDDVVSRNKSAYIEYGLAAPHSLRNAGGSVMWLGRNERGQASVFRMAGYQGAAVSTRAIEERFEGLDISGANAWVYMLGKQEFFCLNCPNVDTTLIYDTTWKQWHEGAELVNGSFQPWRPTCHAFAYGQHYVGADDGIIYRMDSEINNFAGDVKCRSRISPVISDPSQKRHRFSHFEVVCEKANAGTMMLRWKDSDEEAFGSWRYVDAGAAGKPRTRMRANLLGSARNRIYEARVTDDVPWNPVSADVGIV